MNKFSLGEIVATPAIIEAFRRTGQSPMHFVARHQQGDWGMACPEDQYANEKSLRDGSRVLSIYKLDDGTDLWVLTEAEGDDGKRASTCLMLPEDY